MSSLRRVSPLGAPLALTVSGLVGCSSYAEDCPHQHRRGSAGWDRQRWSEPERRNDTKRAATGQGAADNATDGSADNAADGSGDTVATDGSEDTVATNGSTDAVAREAPSPEMTPEALASERWRSSPGVRRPLNSDLSPTPSTLSSRYRG